MSYFRDEYGAPCLTGERPEKKPDAPVNPYVTEAEIDAVCAGLEKRLVLHIYGGSRKPSCAVTFPSATHLAYCNKRHAG